jgi:SAM-dependent methyltransferase
MNELFRALKGWIWMRLGRTPHAYGYNMARWIAIGNDIATGEKGRYGWNGAGFDERVVEYPWVFDRMRALRNQAERVLDMGSVMNNARVLQWWQANSLPPLSIVTLGYEGHAHVSQNVRYEFADMRRLPYRDEWFDAVLCLSTMEHVGMDNTVYGAAAAAVARSSDPDAETATAMAELRRVTKPGGILLISVPFGKRANRGWFRILDLEDVTRLASVPGWRRQSLRVFRSTKDGWRECDPATAQDAGYNEPTTESSRKTAPAWVAGAEAVALVELARA